ncbi:MAG: nucleotidyltransferase family protein [Clostridiales bacterium]|jgi:predicted nucleotidyltransferase|nr:nucleotidyltransferase family protein [Clostridiales bacterium]
MEQKPKVTCIIAEYNPFHNGHAYHLETARRETSPDVLAVVMSGDFTERGDIAVCPKETRARWAALAGADVVYELPPAFAVAPAGDFAYGAIKTLSRLFPRFTLSFGSECGDIKALTRVSDLLSNETGELSSYIKKNLKEGKSYPRARGEAFAALHPDLAPILYKPNNILAIEYIKAARMIGGVDLHTVTREDNFLSTEIKGTFASAAALRELLQNGGDISPYVPTYVTDDIAHAYSRERINALRHGIFRILSEIPKEKLALISGVREGLENRFKKFLPQAGDLNGLLSLVKTKRYTMAALKRICISAYLGITAEMTADFKENPPEPKVLYGK